MVENLALTGFMGTGKSTIGTQVAALLRRGFVDTDVLIEEQHGPIPAIFSDKGEPAFRSIERQVATDLGALEGLVVATGGRMLIDPGNVAALCRNGSRVACLIADEPVLADRLLAPHARSKRPLLDVDDPRGRLHELLDERRGAYAQFPQFDSGSASAAVVASEIASTMSMSHRWSTAGGRSLLSGVGVLPAVRSTLSSERVVVVCDPGRELQAAMLDPDAVVTGADDEPVDGSADLVVAIGSGATMERAMALADRIGARYALVPASVRALAVGVSRPDHALIVDAGIWQSTARPDLRAQGTLGAAAEELLASPGWQSMVEAGFRPLVEVLPLCHELLDRLPRP